MASLRLQDIFGGDGGFERFGQPHWLERGSVSLRLDGAHMPDHVAASADLREPPAFAATPLFDIVEAKAAGEMVVCYGTPDGFFAGL